MVFIVVAAFSELLRRFFYYLHYVRIRHRLNVRFDCFLYLYSEYRRTMKTYKSDFYLLSFSTKLVSTHTSPAWSWKRIPRRVNTKHNWEGEQELGWESVIEWERKNEIEWQRKRVWCDDVIAFLYSSLLHHRSIRPNADHGTLNETRSPSNFIRTSFQFHNLIWSDVLHKQWKYCSEQKPSHRTTWRTSQRFWEWTAVFNA